MDYYGDCCGVFPVGRFRIPLQAIHHIIFGITNICFLESIHSTLPVTVIHSTLPVTVIHSTLPVNANHSSLLTIWGQPFSINPHIQTHVLQ